MYCKQCGQAIDGQAHCTNCGAATGWAGIMPLRVSRVVRHLRTLGILWIVFSVYTILRWLLVLPFLQAFLGGRGEWIAGSETWFYSPFHPGGWLLHFITVAIVVRALLSLAVGIALLTRQPWGRVFAVVVAILTLIKPFIGTALAIYTLWVLLARDADRDYASLAATRELTPP